MNCPVCQSETSPVKIGGQIYCSVCGTAADPGAAAPKRLTLDLAPRNRTNTGATQVVAGPRTSAAAAALHRRVKPGRILDLRNSPVSAHQPEPIAHPVHHDPAPPPKTAAHERHLAHASERIKKAKQVDRSPHIKKFGGGERLTPPTPQPEETATKHAHPIRSHEKAAVLPPHVAAHHEAMAKLAPKTPATPPPPTGAAWRPHLDLSPSRSRVAATVAAVAIMAGYIWLHNYPKLALHSANNKAGVTASLPGYLPSSYTLARTDTSPGLVTLNFSSPSVNEVLKIAQARTPWDSNSLLDNYVAKHTDDYATVQGQGLTIYLFGQNQATWVNKGIWFSIEGTGRLSREQILKVAYSL